MSIVRTFDVFCDSCENWTNGVSSYFADHAPFTNARKQASIVGWKYIGRKDLCPECVKRERGNA